MPAHYCPSHPCPICNPAPMWPWQYPQAPSYIQGHTNVQLGCICPPTSEKTCQSGICPRKNHLRASGGLSDDQ